MKLQKETAAAAAKKEKEESSSEEESSEDEEEDKKEKPKPAEKKVKALFDLSIYAYLLTHMPTYYFNPPCLHNQMSL